MDTSQVTSETVDLLSRITGQKLSQRDITPQVLFLASLVTVLLGVMLVDGTVSEAEKQRLQQILSRFSQSNSDVQKLTNLMIKGVKENQTYKKIQDLLKLTLPLSESEKILLLGFGYEMSIADGEIDVREKQYLGIVAKNLGVKSEYLEVFEIAFTHQVNFDANALNEVHFLLQPSFFQELDIVFVKAASDMLAILPAKPEIKTTQKHTTLSYDKLKKFQVYHQELHNYCNLVSKIINECKDHSFLPSTLIDDITEVYNKIKNQRFRLAVVGEFSQGKSTLLNALLGEEIQPVREIPCSGTISILKYGNKKRVICRYKNGQEEEISLQDYHLKSTISEEAAIECLSDELAHSQIEEIIFEHPDLDLCSSGVEIIDSPGLNEHPDRTLITQKILQDTDAAIFLTNVSRSLTQGERELLQDLRTKLNYGKENEPADNLFVVGNFMDLVRTEKGREQVKQRIEKFVSGQNPIVIGENRVHFISAQAALDAMVQGIEDEYLQSFKDFTLSLEKFLTFESGTLKINRAVNDINQVITKCLDSLYIVEESLDGKIKLSETGKQEILEKIGEASGCDIRIYNLVEKRKELVIEEAQKSWEEWNKVLEKRILQKSKQWSSKHSPVFSQDKLIKDYTNQFTNELMRYIDIWGNQILKEKILQKHLESLSAYMNYELDKIEGEFQKLDQQIKTNFSKQINISITGLNDDFMGFGGIGGGLGIGGALAAALIFFTGIGFIAIAMASVVAAIASSLGLGMLDIDGIHTQIKTTICQIGMQKFHEKSKDKDKISPKDKVYEAIQGIINTVFNNRFEGASQVIKETISIYENILEQQEKAHQENLEQREVKKAFINQKRQELEQVQKELQTMINKSTTL